MKNKLFLIILGVFCAFPVYSQDDLMDLLEEESENQNEIDYTTSTFKATRLLNGHTVETRDNGSLVFMISHRFGSVDSGIRNFFGLDDANIRLALEYGISDAIDIGFGRSSFKQMIDGYFKYKLLGQSSGAKVFPVTLTGFASIGINSQESSNFTDPEVDFSDRVAYSYQLLIARKFNSAISLQVMPTLIHRNQVVTIEDNDIYAVGFGGRYKFSKRTSINLEYYLQFNAEDTYKDAFGIGVDIETGGHVFQLHLTNAQSMIESGFIAETTDDFFGGDIHFGFNISRYFNLKPNRAKGT